MKYQRQIDEIEKYLRDREKSVDEFRVGVEFEHFIVDSESLESVTYYDENGTEDTLKALEERGWEGQYEAGYILGAKKGNKVVTLEPGSQFEFSIVAQEEIKELEVEYQEFVEEISGILAAKGQSLVAIGYHPRTKIDDIKLLPKKRYDYMFEYFKDKGKYAHNMMKGTSALQVSLDYMDEEDYRKKVRIANAMAPIMYGVCDNGPWFEGEEYDKNGLRTNIWMNMDDARSGTVPGSLEDDFSYRKYGEYILNMPPIFTMRDGEAISTGDKKVKDLIDPENYDVKELEHLMTMAFPDVRTKGFIEIRMMDSLPHPYSFGVVAWIIGMFYDEENVQELYRLFEDITAEDVLKSKAEIVDRGIEANLKGRPILDYAEEMLKIAEKSLKAGDREYLEPIKELVSLGKSPRMLAQEKMGLGMKEAIDHLIVRNFEVK